MDKLDYGDPFRKITDEQLDIPFWALSFIIPPVVIIIGSLVTLSFSANDLKNSENNIR